jgi:hypothetical protein
MHFPDFLPFSSLLHRDLCPPAPQKGGEFLNKKKTILKNEDLSPFRGGGGQELAGIRALRAKTYFFRKSIAYLRVVSIDSQMG